MTDLLFDAIEMPTLAVQGQIKRYPVNRIFCVGRNYAAHAAEMGNTVDRDAPWYFIKSPHAMHHAADDLPFAPATQSYHHEVELTVVLGGDLFQGDQAQAAAVIYAYGAGLDMTRRDLQAIAKEKRHPWDTAKNVEESAVLTDLVMADNFGDWAGKAIYASVNGQPRQHGLLTDMIWSVPEIISHLSHLYHLHAGDIIMTGTPAGVGPVEIGDHVTAGIDGLPQIDLQVIAQKS